MDKLQLTDGTMQLQEEVEFSLPGRKGFLLSFWLQCVSFWLPPSCNLFLGWQIVPSWTGIPAYYKPLRLMGLFVTEAWPDLS